MSAQVAIYGRLGGDPVHRQSQTGTDWATGSIAVALSKEEGDASTWFGIVAFGRAAHALCKHSKGDLVSISGRLQLNKFRDRDQKEREQLQVVADAIVSARTVRPGGGRKRGGANAAH